MMAPATRRNARVAAAHVDAVMRASRALVGIAAESIAEVDGQVTLPQLRVLVMVSTRGPLNLVAVASGLGVSASNASRICDRLRNAGLLDRRDLPTDRRNVTLTLTDAGRSLVDKVMRHRRTAITRVLRNMDAGEREQLAAALGNFAAAAGETLDEQPLSLI
ncbi:MarR family transcriptional regulator [Mycobacterium sp.]|uniref:MarR family winged helix-turn-helix transcriptional regulator n=1 Tax=Mycobacterium sp. TaxID=1785 RepID=UPI002D331FE6|nr:MarR family transcriptional regulator [Mycobacterium sp.]HZA08877.1 MarR family transcriptional regulator [Mycobacterium sp.]